ncbi:sel1 repeat family protein [Caproiciproducens sp. NJN-50]|uniref:MobP3 family relaxase n=1 Tax=Caproiciproducens sp. NJN-50 TaxID=2507162 RepID=UPI000FFE178E|nr:MobP3 family relaxase [Caproiciproducens sp. NJN-50]QAT49896.1 sel1 repeat family protein [Caproiciproducens sp. NJN-50]
MPRIIFKCRYLKNAAAHAENLVTYVATREGVEKIPQNRQNLPATVKQKLLITDILARFPDSDRLFEYEDYQNSPTVENASELISAALDQNLDQLSHQEVYVNYIATRPRAEKLGAHGLFSDENTPLVLLQAAEEAARHTGNIWTPIISLRREDAARLGYDNAAAWMALLRKQRNIFAEQMKITPENLRWYAAFHNEGHHPHCHMIVYSADSREGYVTKPAIETMRSSLAREIFQQDLLQIYSEQTVRRDSLTAESRDTLRELLEQMEDRICASPVIEDLMSRLAERLKYTAGKKQYGYLKAPLKELVNQIVDELAKDERVAAAYAKWQELRNEVLRTYKDQLPEPLPLSQQKEFKQIKNMVIAEAVSLGDRHVTFEGDEDVGPSSEEENGALETEPKLPLPEPPEIVVNQDDVPDDTPDDAPPSDSDRTASGKPHIAWNDRYKQARTFLFGNDETEPDFEQALRLFLEEAEDGNVLAMHDLGRMYADGLGREIDTGTSFSWYAKALSSFEDIESEKENRYVEYRIGKMYAAGLGTEQDYEEAAGWFGEAVSKNHKYAQYSLAGLYFRGQGVKQNYETAFSLYLRAAVQHTPYADYELAKMYRDGIGTVVNSAEAARHFKIAFQGFQQMEKQSRDDKLQYRLGQMLYTGTGTEKDVEAALGYFEKSARLGNVHAQYMLGRIYLDADGGHENTEQAVRWLTKSADGGNALAQYALGKLCRDGTHVEKDISRAISLFTLAAEQENSYAAYALGRLYLQNEDIPKDVDAAVKWLEKSADLGNQFAQYTLAKLYLSGEDVPKDIPKVLELFQKSAAQGNSLAQYRLGRLYLLGEDVPKDVEAAIRWLTLSAEQGNIYARFFLDHPDSFQDPPLFLAATRLLHHLSRIFREEQERLPGGPRMQVESKLRRKIRQKKIAQGHAPDDHEQKLITY